MKKLSKKEIDYWLFSNSSTATFFRCRNEIALEEIRGVTDEEAKDICFKIRKALERGKFYEIYVKLLVLFNDKEALNSLRKVEQEFLKRRNSSKSAKDWEYEIRLLNNAIKHLESI